MKRALLVLLLIALPSSTFAQTRWIEDPDFGFKISVPTSYQTNAYMDGTDKVHAFVSPDQNLAIRVRSVPLPQQVGIDMVIPLFEQNVLPGAQRLLIQDHVLNGISGKMAAYRWNYQGTQVAVGSFYTIQPGFFHVVWYLVPENLFQAKTQEGDAVITTFTFLSAATPQPSAGLGGMLGPQNPGQAAQTPPPAATPPSTPPTTIGGRVNRPGAATPPPATPPPTTTRPATPPPPTTPPTAGSQPSRPAVQPSQPTSGAAAGQPKAGYVMLVEHTAGIEFAIPLGFTQTSQKPGEQIWQGPAGTEDAEVKMAIQTIGRSNPGYGTLEEAFQDLAGQVERNPGAEMVDVQGTVEGQGVRTKVYSFDFEQAVSTIRFVYTVIESDDYINIVSFLGPVQRAYRQELHAEETARTAQVYKEGNGNGNENGNGNGNGPAASTQPASGSGALVGPLGPHVASNLPPSADGNREARGNWSFYTSSSGLRFEVPNAWKRTNNGSITMWSMGTPQFKIQNYPKDRETRESLSQKLSAGGDRELGTLSINGIECRALQGSQTVGMANNQTLRHDRLVFEHGHETYVMTFSGVNTPVFDEEVGEVARTVLASLKKTR